MSMLDRPHVLTAAELANVTDGADAASPAYLSGAVASGRYEVKMLGWNTPPEYMDFVNPYWKTFEAPNPFLHYMLGVFYIMFMFAALCGNGVVLWVFTSAKSLRTPSNMFVVNLALLDFIMMLKTPVFIINSFNEGPIWGKFGCDMFALMGSYSGISGAMTNAAIAYDRYKTIAKPFEPKIKSGTAFLMVLGTWAYATPWCMMPLFGIWGRFVPVRCDMYVMETTLGWTQTSRCRRYKRGIRITIMDNEALNPRLSPTAFDGWGLGHVRWCMMLSRIWEVVRINLRGREITHFVPYSCKACPYSSSFSTAIYPCHAAICNCQVVLESITDILDTPCQQAKKMNVDNLRSVGSKEDQEKSAEIRIAKVCMGLFFMFLVSWTPYAVVALIGAFGNRSVLTPLVSMIPALTCKSMACIDPWVYAINHPRYRLELQKRLPWFCIHEEKPQDTVSQSSNNTEKA
ncbi:opsin, ultraviolet-sensitive-like [Penaeus chinensis]|uniref:opsin, ultraviolet-sensitive-like n=1 Tax=Penaeus chinensis TaxID=139456 RepID=UPI001FB63F65|nr:opsin, ultraviolet-sensitive-like [Penaeus chinensis]